MIARPLATAFLVAHLLGSAQAQERVVVGTMRDVANGALFLAAVRGYFKAEGLDLNLLAYTDSGQAVRELGAGATDFAVVAFSADAFKLAGSGAIKAIAAQVREERSYEGNQVVVSTSAYSRGLVKLEELAGRSIAITAVGSPFHYQLARIAAANHFDLDHVALKLQPSLDAIVELLAANKVDAAILPPQQARELLLAGQARLLGWCADFDQTQLGAVFVSAKVLSARPGIADKFLRAYRRAVADYWQAFLRHDSYGKRRSDKNSQAAAAEIARYVFPGQAAASAGPKVEDAVYFMDAQARLDLADIERQVAWYKSVGLLDRSVEAGSIVQQGPPPGR